jgi:hypothetical protein
MYYRHPFWQPYAGLLFVKHKKNIRRSSQYGVKHKPILLQAVETQLCQTLFQSRGKSERKSVPAVMNLN